jgi:ferric-dicitrate binding protein FerR (iron transport regulator)
MKRKQIKKLEDLLNDASFRKWVDGASDSQAPFWENWVKQHPRHQELAEKAIAILNGLPFQLKESDLPPAMVEEEWNKLRSKTKKQSPGIRPGLKSRRLRGRAWRLRLVAGLALLVLCGWLLEYFVMNPLVEYRTPFGQQLTISLPDSTLVKLNANSILAYRERNPRKVWLDGEAFFEVKKKPTTGAHFLVLTNDLTVEVLGTAFNVIEKLDKTEVMLEEGSVKLNLNRNFEQELLMEPGDLVTFSTQAKQTVERRQVQAEIVSSWKDGVLEFEDVALTEIMERIKAIYGWEALYYDESLKSRKISLGLPSEDLESALLILSKTMGMKIEKVQGEGNVLLLRYN